MRDDKIVADLYRPKQPGRGPAAVIINSSGGVQPHTELYYARVFARQGLQGVPSKGVALVVTAEPKRPPSVQWRVGRNT
jgi:hypothetical protein